MPTLNQIHSYTPCSNALKWRVPGSLGHDLMDCTTCDISPCSLAWALSSCVVWGPWEPRRQSCQDSVTLHSLLLPLPQPPRPPSTEQLSGTWAVVLARLCAPAAAARGEVIGRTSAWMKRSWRRSGGSSASSRWKTQERAEHRAA